MLINRWTADYWPVNFPNTGKKTPFGYINIKAKFRLFTVPIVRVVSHQEDLTHLSLGYPTLILN